MYIICNNEVPLNMNLDYEMMIHENIIINAILRSSVVCVSHLREGHGSRPLLLLFLLALNYIWHLMTIHSFTTSGGYEAEIAISTR